jgi:tetratricopeptide (TPR) repeat protein
VVRAEHDDPFLEPLVEPYSGRFAEVMRLVVAGDASRAEREALAWRDAEPLETLALVALGEALEAAGKRDLAARAYGSLIDLYPARADFRRFAAGRLERLGRGAFWLSEDSYRKALEQRPDHVTSHQLLAYSLLRQERVEEAFTVLETLAQRYGIQSRELREDVRLVAAVLARRKPDSPRPLALLKSLGLELPRGPTARVLLTWETDANDVDLHVIDRHGEHAYYERLALSDGGSLLGDVTNGYGPEEFLLAPRLASAPYELFVNYYASGPMGFGS